MVKTSYDTVLDMMLNAPCSIHNATVEYHQLFFVWGNGFAWNTDGRIVQEREDTDKVKATAFIDDEKGNILDVLFHADFDHIETDAGMTLMAEQIAQTGFRSAFLDCRAFVRITDITQSFLSLIEEAKGLPELPHYFKLGFRLPDTEQMMHLCLCQANESPERLLKVPCKVVLSYAFDEVRDLEVITMDEK